MAVAAGYAPNSVSFLARSHLEVVSMPLLRVVLKPSTAYYVMGVASLLVLAGCNKTSLIGAVATVNGHAIMRADLDQEFERHVAEAEPQEQSSEEQAGSLRLNLLETMIEEEMLVQQATKADLTATSDEVDTKIKEVRGSNTTEQFQARLRQNHTSEEVVRRHIRRSIEINKLYNKEINAKIRVSDSEIANYYRTHTSEFDSQDVQYHIAQILVRSTIPTPRSSLPHGQTAFSLDGVAAQKKINTLKRRVDSGEDFSSLAIKFSEDVQTSASGGDMGMISETQLKGTPLAFEAISKLKPKQTTPVLAFPDQNDPHRIRAYAILQLISKEPAGQKTLAEPWVQQQIRQELHDARSELLRAAYLDMLRSHTKIMNYYAIQLFGSDAR